MTEEEKKQQVEVQSPPIGEIDGIMWMILKDFIKEGIPSPDPVKQIAMAYHYSFLITQFRKKHLRHMIPKEPVEGMSCTECKVEMGSLTVPVLDGPSKRIWVCPQCNKQVMEDIKNDKTKQD